MGGGRRGNIYVYEQQGAAGCRRWLRPSPEQQGAASTLQLFPAGTNPAASQHERPKPAPLAPLSGSFPPLRRTRQRMIHGSARQQVAPKTSPAEPQFPSSSKRFVLLLIKSFIMNLAGEKGW